MSAGPSARVLVVDDDRHVCPSFVRFLEHAGVEAAGCADVSSAMALAEHESFAGFVIDIMFYDVPEGCRLIERLRADPKNAAKPILAVTGFGSEHLDEALRAGADAALP